MTLKEIRNVNNLTQEKFASFLGLPLRTYKRYESDEAKIPKIKYEYIKSKVDELGVISEEQGVLTVGAIKEICARILSKYNVEYCYLFGSYAKGKATPKSDVDLFISTTVTGLEYFGLVEELRTELKKKVDLLNQNQIKDNFELTNEILTDGVKIYG
jgi:predicted nucleotidyltransferase